MKKEIEYNSQTNRSTKVFVMTLIGGIFLFLGGFALYAHLTSKKGDDEERDASATSANNFAASSDAGFKCLSTSYPLQLGTCHSDVAIVQRYLKKLGAVLGNTGKNKDGVDGRFGPKTLEATKQYLNKEIFNIQDVQTSANNSKHEYQNYCSDAQHNRRFDWPCGGCKLLCEGSTSTAIR